MLIVFISQFECFAVLCVHLTYDKV